MGLLGPPGFRRNRHGRVTLHLDDADRTLMHTLLAQLGELLGQDDQEPERPRDPLEELVGIEPTAQRPTDPALARLFPDGYEDPELADEFRRFTQRDLREGKQECLAVATATLDRADPIKLDEDECQAWLRTLNDLRLALGTRLGVTDDDQEGPPRLPDDDPRATLHAVYDWLTYHQDRLVHAVERGLRP